VYPSATVALAPQAPRRRAKHEPEYKPRLAESTALHRVVRGHLLTFLDRAAERHEGRGVPRFVEKELRRFVGCGVRALGFARLRCGDCANERLVPFSCKGRGFCPSCCGRRMVERSAHLVDEVLPPVPFRQWGLSLPLPLRHLFAFDHKLCLAALAIYVRALRSFQRRRARQAGVVEARCGGVTVIQRFGSGLRLNIHFHTLLLDGVFVEAQGGELAFHSLPPPTDNEVVKLTITIRKRILRLLRRRGVLDDDDRFGDEGAPDATALSDLAGASVTNTQAFGARAGVPITRVGGDPRAPWICSRAALHAHLDGFDLHAAVAIAATDRPGLERLARYLLRPPIAQERLEVLDDDRIRVQLRSPWSDGTSHLIFEPLELLGRLASFVPRPRSNLVIYHGVFAPNAKWRARAVAFGRPTIARTNADDDEASPRACCLRRRMNWADLMRRAFGIDVLACNRCGGKMRLLATIEAPQIVRAILDHLGLPSSGPRLAPARASPDEHPLWH